MLVDIILATSAVSLISLVGILLIFKGNKPVISLKSFISFAAGSLLGVTFLELLPELFEHSVFTTRELFFAVLVSIVFFFIIERFMHWHHCLCHGGHSHADHEVLQKSKKKVLITNNLIGDAVHNLIDGFLIAAAFMVNKEVGLTVTLGVIIHEIPQEISDFGVLLYGGLSKAKALLFNLLIALASIIGAVLFYFFLHDYQWLSPLFVAFAAGNFIYLAMADIIPQLHEEKKTSHFLKHTLWFLAGILIMWFSLGGFGGHSHSHEINDGHNHEISHELEDEHHDEDGVHIEDETSPVVDEHIDDDHSEEDGDEHGH